MDVPCRRAQDRPVPGQEPAEFPFDVLLSTYSCFERDGANEREDRKFLRQACWACCAIFMLFSATQPRMTALACSRVSVILLSASEHPACNPVIISVMCPHTPLPRAAAGASRSLTGRGRTSCSTR